MSKNFAKPLAFGAIVLIAALGAAVGIFMPEAAPAVAVAFAVFAVAVAAVAVSAGAVAVGAFAFAAAFAGIFLANDIIDDYYVRKGE